MQVDLGIRFPSEAEAMRKQVGSEEHLTAAERLAAAMDIRAVAELLSRSGGIRAEQMKYHARLEEDWQRQMKEFIKNHVGS